MQFDTDIRSPHKELFLETRKLLLSYRFVEAKKNRITTYANENGGICHMRTMKHGIDIGFLKGVRMEDDFRLLKGDGKLMRVLSLSSLNRIQVEYYINQAIEINGK